MNTRTVRALALSLLAVAAAAQDQATTLTIGCRAADTIVAATVESTTTVGDELVRIELRTDEVLKGSVGARFVVVEPAGRCCGRGLFTLAEGARPLLFLRRTGAVLHPWAGGRGVLDAEPMLLAHVRALLAAADERSRQVLLSSALVSPHRRIAADAAHALAAAPSLVLDESARRTLVASLQEAVQHGDPLSAPLLDTALRTGAADVLDAVLPLYLDTRRGDQARLLRSGLQRTASPGEVVARLPLHMRNDEDHGLRATGLLGVLEGPEAQAALRTIVQTTPHPRVQASAVECLLAAGAQPTSLPAHVPAAVVEHATRRLRSTPRFRTIDPTRR